MEFPDQLKKPAPTRHPDIDALDDLLWEAASWHPDVEQVIQDGCPEGTDRELIRAARRLLDDGLLDEPVLAYRAIRLLVSLGEFRTEGPAARVWPTAGRIGSSHVRDQLRVSGPAAGPVAGRMRGVHEALKTPGVRLLCITGPPGIGKTRLATDIAVESRQKILAALREEPRTAGHDDERTKLEEAVPLLEISLRSAESGAGNRRLALAPYDALLDLLLALRVPEADIPATLEGRRACYTAELKGRQPVILVDDAIDESQVLPLLPPDRGVVVVTSRHSLVGLFAYGAAYPPLAALDAYGTGPLVRSCFQELGVQPGDAAVAAIHEWCAGMPLPTILISRWMAAAARAEQVPAEELTARLDAARREWQPDRRGDAAPGLQPAFAAVAAVFSLLSPDQQAIVRMLGLLRLPEADIRAVCIGTGLAQDQALTALEQLAGMGLLAQDEPGTAWTMAPAVADYACAWALAPDQRLAAGYEQMLVPLIGLYQERAQDLRDLLSELRPDSDALPLAHAGAEWAEAEWAAARDVLAALLDAADAAENPAQARGIAAAYLEMTGYQDGRERGWREADRYIGPVLPVARAAIDHRLEAKALERLGHDAARQNQDASASELRRAARDAEIAADGAALGPGTAQTREAAYAPDQAVEPLAGSPVADGSEPAVEPASRPAAVSRPDLVIEPAVASAPKPKIRETKAAVADAAEAASATDGLTGVEKAIGDDVAAPAGPLLFGARA